MSSCSVEIIDFIRPEGNRKNLFITNIPGNSETDIQVSSRALLSKRKIP